MRRRISAGSKPGEAWESAVKLKTGQTSWAGSMMGSAGGAGPDKTVKAFVDFQNDVTAKDIRLAVREGMHSIEHVKRFTTNGMATDQGKTVQHSRSGNRRRNARQADAAGRTDHVPFALHADDLRRDRQSFARQAVRSDAQDADAWLGSGSMARCSRMSASGSGPGITRAPARTCMQAVNRECRTVREAAGMFDASTLGKIEVVGPDAAKFLDLMYTNPFWDKLGVGAANTASCAARTASSMMTAWSARIAEDRFHVTTTTGGAPRVLHHMEDYLQTEFPDLKVWLTSTSEQWAVIAVQGPKAREIIEPLVEGIDLSTRPCRI
jgi:sarcosine oxidase subunit alpha